MAKNTERRGSHENPALRAGARQNAARRLFMRPLGQKMRSPTLYWGVNCGLNPRHAMKTNIGSYDAGLRFIVGCFVLGGLVHGWGWWSLAGLALILTAMCEICPIYCLLRLNTARLEERLEERHHRHHPPAAKA